MEGGALIPAPLAYSSAEPTSPERRTDAPRPRPPHRGARLVQLHEPRGLIQVSTTNPRRMHCLLFSPRTAWTEACSLHGALPAPGVHPCSQRVTPGLVSFTRAAVLPTQCRRYGVPPRRVTGAAGHAGGTQQRHQQRGDAQALPGVLADLQPPQVSVWWVVGGWLVVGWWVVGEWLVGGW